MQKAHIIKSLANEWRDTAHELSTSILAKIHSLPKESIFDVSILRLNCLVDKRIKIRKYPFSVKNVHNFKRYPSFLSEGLNCRPLTYE